MCCCRLGSRLAMINPAKFCRSVSLAISCIGMTISGSIYSFNAYSNAIQERFSLTQPQVELAAAVLNLGFCIGFPAGMFQERFGPTCTFLLASLLGTLAYVLLWSSTVLVDVFTQHPALIDCCFFLQGFASMFLYMGCLPANMHNFSASNRGKVVTLLDAFFGAGAAVFSAVYSAGFRGDGKQEPFAPPPGNIKSYFLMMSLLFAIIGILGMAFVRQIPWEEDELGTDTGNEESSLVQLDDHRACVGQNTSGGGAFHENHLVTSAETHVTGQELLRTLNFHLLFWSFVIFSSVELVFYNNMSVYLKSFGQLDHLLMLEIMGPTVATVIKPMYGWVSDALIKRIPRVLYLLVLNAMSTILLVMCTFLADRIGVFTTASLILWLANAVLWGMTPTILSELFGMRYFARNWGSMHIGFGLFSWLLHLFYGYMYETAIGRDKGGTLCYGQHCFTWSFFILALLCCCATTMNAVLLIRQLGMRRRACVPPPPPPPPPPPHAQPQPPTQHIRYETRID